MLLTSLVARWTLQLRNTAALSLHELRSMSSVALRRVGAKRPALAASLLVMATLAAACAGDDEALREQPADRAPIPVKVAQVSRGDIAATLAYSGEIRPVDRIELLPSIGGRLVEVLVDEGAEVAAGAALAQLETDTLEVQMQQEEANVQSAQARLDTVLQGARPEEIAAARAHLRSLQQKLQGMIDGGRFEDIVSATAGVNAAMAKLADLEAGPKAADLAAAQAAVDTAAASLSSGEANLRQMLNPTELDIEATQAALDAAQADLESAQASLDDLRARPKPEDVAAGRGAVAAAEASLANADSAFEEMRKPLTEEKLRALIEAYSELKLARIRLAEAKARGEPPEVIEMREDEVNRALRLLDAAEATAETFETGVSVEEIIAGEAAVESAQANLVSAQIRLDTLLEGPTVAALQAAQAALDRARANVEAAQVGLDRLRQPTAASIAAAEAAVEKARASLRSSQARLKQLRDGATAAELEAAKAGLSAAESSLAKTTSPFTETDVGAQAALVAQAEQQVLLTLHRYTKADIDGAAAAVAQAQAALALRRLQLDRATVVAPFDALVAIKHVSKGSLVSQQTPLFSLISRDLQIVFNVEEGAIGRVKTGLPVTFQVAAYRETPFRGRIARAAPTADSASRTFRVEVAPDPGQEKLRAGMFANVTVAVEAQDAALLVPNEAIIQRGDESFVFVVRNNRAEQRKVELGLRNDRFAQVRSGLEEGDQVVVRGNRTLRPEDLVTIVP